ncbi:MAG: 23S rRNA (adenine(2503)-C(2))-methyltransferase RlmN [Treponema sp.]|jgi:23S rRNA (adenine2503-C2)-methyltransferase|nr:23S rRNA (adenine(2503)-C(2))-methyltransferase RlmN [Treponema sp.]
MILCGMPLAELAEELKPLPRFRAVQIFKWIASGVSDFEKMGNLPLELRKDLAERYALRPQFSAEEHSGSDGAAKLAMRAADGALIEAVLLCDKANRRTACLSTQAGCPAACVFCKTGTNFARDLDSAEIVEQFLRLRAIAKEAHTKAQRHEGTKEKPYDSIDAIRPVANIVIMGMGEPLLNLAELRRAIDVIGCKEGLNFSRRRITVSTCGIASGIIDLAHNGPGVRLALSLTTADEGLRRRLMPITEKEPLDKVKGALKIFQECGGGRITLEAVLLGGINTRSADAQSIAEFASGLDATVNLIPWNPVKGLEFEGRPLSEPSAAEVESFKQQLESMGLNVTRRYRRGRGVAGACGQLGK